MRSPEQEAELNHAALESAHLTWLRRSPAWRELSGEVQVLFPETKESFVYEDGELMLYEKEVPYAFGND